MSGQRVVKVWFGSVVVAKYQAAPEVAAGYARAMDRRYPGVRITNDPAVAGGPELRRMPGERLWADEPALT